MSRGKRNEHPPLKNTPCSRCHKKLDLDHFCRLGVEGCTKFVIFVLINSIKFCSILVEFVLTAGSITLAVQFASNLRSKKELKSQLLTQRMGETMELIEPGQILLPKFHLLQIRELEVIALNQNLPLKTKPNLNLILLPLVHHPQFDHCLIHQVLAILKFN